LEVSLNKLVVVFAAAVLGISMAYRWYEISNESRLENAKQKVLSDLKKHGIEPVSGPQVLDRTKILSDPKAQLERAKSMAQSVQNMSVAKVLQGAQAQPDTFKMKSLIVKANGIACYEFDVKDANGVKQALRASLSEDGRLFVEGWNDTAMTQLWDKECVSPTGLQLAT
jgi:hypothetical protein